MKLQNIIASAVGIILLSITSIYLSNINKDKVAEPSNGQNFFWKNHQLNCKNSVQFNMNSCCCLKESIIFNDRTTVISNKETNISKDELHEDKNGNHESTEIESGNIRWKILNLQNINIPTNTIISTTELALYQQKYCSTTTGTKTEYLKSSTSYTNEGNYLSTKSTTSKSVDWYIPKLSNSLELTSPNIRDVVQEVVNTKKDIVEATNNNYKISKNITIHQAPKNATAVITSNSNTPSNPNDDVITQTLNTDFDGTKNFKFTICYGSNNCNKVNVHLIINAVVDSCNAALSRNFNTGKDGIANIYGLKNQKKIYII